MATAATPRKIAFSFLAREQAEGQGARVRRSIGTPKLRNFSPFLMLDHFRVSRGAGFPDHPHRGQETITYLLKGHVDHEDFCGNAGSLDPGDLQFMTAGRGIVHAEMPRHDEGSDEPVEGMQLWVDLPARLKTCEPRYRDLRAKEIPLAVADDGRVQVKVISGESHGVTSVQELAYTPVWLLDVTVQPGGSIEQALPQGWNAFAYTIDGVTRFGDVTRGSNATSEDGVETVSDGKEVGPFHNVVFTGEGDNVLASVDAGAPGPARFILVAGTPLDQEVVQYGPFVLTSKQEVMQALRDYQSYSNGFEKADGFQSEIGKRILGH